MDKQKEKRFSDAFYVSAAWRKCREDYINSVGGICEKCLERGLIVPGDEVHHKIALTPQNISNPSISLCWDNLQLLCEKCHKTIKNPERRWTVDEYGHVEPKDTPL